MRGLYELWGWVGRDEWNCLDTNISTYIQTDTDILKRHLDMLLHKLQRLNDLLVVVSTAY